MSQLLLSSFASFLTRVKGAPWLFLGDVCSSFSFDSMPNLHLGISKLLKICFLGYVGSTALYTSKGGSVTVGTALLSMKRA